VCCLSVCARVRERGWGGGETEKIVRTRAKEEGDKQGREKGRGKGCVLSEKEEEETSLCLWCCSLAWISVRLDVSCSSRVRILSLLVSSKSVFLCRSFSIRVSLFVIASLSVVHASDAADSLELSEACSRRLQSLSCLSRSHICDLNFSRSVSWPLI